MAIDPARHPSRPVDEPLRWMLTNPRALKLTRTRDNLWLRILDVRAALEARTYAAQRRRLLRRVTVRGVMQR
jgi:predicted acetyltransferase